MGNKKTKGWAERVKEIRLRNGISQRNLGIAAGLDPFVASARMNRYERRVHDPDPGISRRIAEALQIPHALLYAEEDDLAEMIELYSLLNKEDKEKALGLLRQLSQHESNE